MAMLCAEQLHLADRNHSAVLPVSSLLTMPYLAPKFHMCLRLKL